MGLLNKFDHAVEKSGHDLVRPECVLATAEDDIYLSDFRGGISCIKSNGQQEFRGGEHPEFGLLQTNGFAMLENDSFLIVQPGLTGYICSL